MSVASSAYRRRHTSAPLPGVESESSSSSDGIMSAAASAYQHKQQKKHSTPVGTRDDIREQLTSPAWTDDEVRELVDVVKRTMDARQNASTAPVWSTFDEVMYEGIRYVLQDTRPTAQDYSPVDSQHGHWPMVGHAGQTFIETIMPLFIDTGRYQLPDRKAIASFHDAQQYWNTLMKMFRDMYTRLRDDWRNYRVPGAVVKFDLARFMLSYPNSALQEDLRSNIQNPKQVVRGRIIASDGDAIQVGFLQCCDATIADWHKRGKKCTSATAVWQSKKETPVSVIVPAELLSWPDRQVPLDHFMPGTYVKWKGKFGHQYYGVVVRKYDSQFGVKERGKATDLKTIKDDGLEVNREQHTKTKFKVVFDYRRYFDE